MASSPLNPQPLPPGPPPELYGVAVGKELLRLSWQAEKLGYQLEMAYNAWREGYYLGLACALAVAPEPQSESSFAAEVFAKAVTALAGVPTPTLPVPIRI